MGIWRPIGWTRLVACLVVAVAVASCTPGIDTAELAAPIDPQVVEVTMRDGRYLLKHDQTLRAGRVEFRVSNDGTVDHDLSLVKLPDGVAGVKEWLDSGVSGVSPVYIMADRAPGEDATFAVDLPAGRYGMLCFTTNSNGTPHYKQGMVADFEIAQPAPASPADVPSPASP